SPEERASRLAWDARLHRKVMKTNLETRGGADDLDVFRERVDRRMSELRRHVKALPQFLEGFMILGKHLLPREPLPVAIVFRLPAAGVQPRHSEIRMVLNASRKGRALDRDPTTPQRVGNVRA